MVNAVNFTTASFFFNLGLNIAIFIALFLLFLIYRRYRGDKETLGNKGFSYHQLHEEASAGRVQEGTSNNNGTTKQKKNLMPFKIADN